MTIEELETIKNDLRKILVNDHNDFFQEELIEKLKKNRNVFYELEKLLGDKLSAFEKTKFFLRTETEISAFSYSQIVLENFNHDFYFHIIYDQLAKYIESQKNEHHL